MIQDSSTVKTATDVIDHIASRLRVPATQVWRTLQIQARIEFWQSIVWLVIGIATVVAVSIGWRMACHAVARLNGDKPNYPEGVIDHPEWVIPLGIASLIAVIFFFAAVAGAVNGLGYYLNPDFYALKTVLKVLQ